MSHLSYAHPEVVVGEPIPVIEPRVDRASFLVVRRLNRWCMWYLPVYLVVSFGVAFVFAGRGYEQWVVGFGIVLCGGVLLRYRKQLSEYKADPWCIPFRENACYRILGGVSGVVLFLPVFVENGLSWVLGMLGAMLAMLGVMVLFGFRGAREPGQISCRGCCYPLAGLTLACSCPECGVMIEDKKDTTDSVRVELAWFVPIGLVLVVMGGGLLFGVMQRPGMVYIGMPRGALLRLAATDEGAFGELVSKPMADAQRAELIDVVISGNRLDGGWGYRSRDQQAWLGQFIGTDQISDEQYQSMYGPIASRIRIEQVVDGGRAGHGRVGEPIRVRLASAFVNAPESSTVIRYYCRGFVFGDGSLDAAGLGEGGGDGDLHVGLLDNEVDDGGRWVDYVPHARYTPELAGELVIRARVVVVLVPKGGASKIRWADPGGYFAFEPMWSVELDLEFVIEVEG